MPEIKVVPFVRPMYSAADYGSGCAKVLMFYQKLNDQNIMLAAALNKAFGAILTAWQGRCFS